MALAALKPLLEYDAEVKHELPLPRSVCGCLVLLTSNNFRH